MFQAGSIYPLHRFNKVVFAKEYHLKQLPKKDVYNLLSSATLSVTMFIDFYELKWIFLKILIMSTLKVDN